MPTLTDTKFNHALTVPVVAGEPPLPEILITRPHADGVITDNKDPDSMVHTSAEGIASMDGSDRLASNAGDNRFESNVGAGFFGGLGNDTLDTGAGVRGGIVAAPHEDFSSYVTNGTTDTVSRSGNNVGIADITDGTSNTLAFARIDGGTMNHLFETEAADYSTMHRAGVSDGTSNTIMIGERSAAGNVIESVATKYTMFDGAADHLSLGGDGADRLVRADDLGVHGLQIGGPVLEVGDVLMGSIDNSNDSAHAHTVGGSTTLDADADGQADGLNNVANVPAGSENLDGNINNIDAWVGGIVLDIDDVLGDVDAAGGNAAVQTRMAGGSANIQLEPDGQANGIIAVLIGVSADDQGPLNNPGLALD